MMIQDKKVLTGPPSSAPVLTPDIWNTFIRFRKVGTVVSRNGFTALRWAAGDKWAISRGLATMDPTRWDDFLMDREESNLLANPDVYYRHELLPEYVSARLQKSGYNEEVCKTVWGFLATIGIMPN